MSEFSGKQKFRAEQLTAYTEGLIKGLDGAQLLKDHRIKDTVFMPIDILQLFDNLFEKNLDIADIKAASNKLFNIIYENLEGYEKYNYPENSVIKYLIDDNSGLKKYLTQTKAIIKKINKEITPETLKELLQRFREIEKFVIHYTLKENIVFPEIEKKWDHYQCLKLMWSFHDDIRKNIKLILKLLSGTDFDLSKFNLLCGKIFFNIYTIIFREENVLFPIMYETMDEDIFNRMDSQLHEFKLAFADIELNKNSETKMAKGIKMKDQFTVKLSTGELKLEQLELIFNHLPVDITFVDENDKVRYFSTPKDRIFPRTKGIIGRTVLDCHPHESVDVVGRIVESFKSAEKDDASFWLQMGDKFILIRYFAVRDSDGVYKGVLEVSQEISDLKKLEGERRLLDWE